MTLREYIDSLSKDKQFALAIRLTRSALPVCEKYADNNDLSYRDSVIGLHHSVDRQLLHKTINAVEKFVFTNRIKRIVIKNIDLLSADKQFSDPIAALQDTDWELPYDVERTFYAVHNLLAAALGNVKNVFNETKIYVAINQAAEALASSKTLTEEEIRRILYENKNGV